MKAILIAQSSEAIKSLCAGARTQADEVVLVSFSGVEIPEGVADSVAILSLPEGAIVDDAANSIIDFVKAEGADAIYVESTRSLKVIAGSVAHALNTSAIGEVIEFSAEGATSMYFGGVAHKTEKASSDVAVYICSKDAFGKNTPSGANASKEISYVAPERAVELVEETQIEKSGVDLNSTDVVVAAGRGFGAKEDLALAQTLADKLGGGLGCSRPLTEGVDWMPRESYIGVSGLMLAPKVYLGIGISGQMQHMVGANRTETVFAINKDKNAPIFKQCDYGLVGDLYDILPQLNNLL